jgi:predicted transcriptional regulator
MGVDKKRQFLLQVLELYRKGFNQKEISKNIGITEKTVGVWLKELKLKKENNKVAIDRLEIRLSELISDKNTPTKNIKDVVSSIEKLEKRWFNELIITDK